MFSLFIWFALAYGFRKMRRIEVQYMYLKIVLAKKLILKEISEDNLESNTLIMLKFQ